MLSNFLKDDGNIISFTGHCLEIYIPEMYFDKQIASVEGEIVKTFGVLPCAVFDANMKELNRYIINLPTTILFYLKDIKSEKIVLTPERTGAEPEPCRVLRFFKNDNVMPSSIEQDSSNVEMFFINILCSGKLTFIPYNKLLEVWEKNLEINGVKLGLTGTTLEIILAEIYRNKDNLNEKFSKVLNENPKTSQYDYHASNIREICSRTSVFAALTFEDMDSMITTSLNMSNYNKKQVESPLEKILKM